MTSTGPRQAILEAAIDTFAERGFRGASTTAIAERAGVSQPVIHYHYGSKARLLDEAIRAMEESFAAAAQSLMIFPDAGHEELSAYLADIVVRLGEQARYVRLQRTLSAENDPELVPVLYQRTNQILESVEAALTVLAPHSKPETRQATTRMLVSTVNEINVARLYQISDVPPWDDWRFGPMLRLLVDGLTRRDTEST